MIVFSTKYACIIQLKLTIVVSLIEAMGLSAFLDGLYMSTSA